MNTLIEVVGYFAVGIFVSIYDQSYQPNDEPLVSVLAIFVWPIVLLVHIIGWVIRLARFIGEKIQDKAYSMREERYQNELMKGKYNEKTD